MQISQTFDPTTVRKILHGLLISIGGALFAGFLVLSPEIGDFLQIGDPINWAMFLYTVWGALSTSIINAGYQYFKGITPPQA